MLLLEPCEGDGGAAEACKADGQKAAGAATAAVADKYGPRCQFLAKGLGGPMTQHTLQGEFQLDFSKYQILNDLMYQRKMSHYK